MKATHFCRHLLYILNPLLESDSRSQKPSHFLAIEKLHNKFVYPQLLYLANNHCFVDRCQAIRLENKERGTLVQWVTDNITIILRTGLNHIASDNETFPCFWICHCTYFTSLLWSCKDRASPGGQGSDSSGMAARNDTLDTAITDLQVSFLMFHFQNLRICSWLGTAVDSLPVFTWPDYSFFPDFCCCRA